MSPKTDAGASSVGIALFGAVLFIATVVGGLFFQLPVVTLGARSVSYSIVDLTNASFSQQKIPSARLEAEKNYGIDVSVIFTPRHLETSPGLQKLAGECLPRGKVKTFAMPDTAHQTFAQATEYLSCVMRLDQHRLCDAAERQRLVDQLMQYRTLRQHLLAIERARDSELEHVKKSPFGQYAMEMMEITGEWEGTREAKNPPVRKPSIGKQIDPRIASGLAELKRRGFISLSDFTWFVIFAPEEYAPFLDRKEAVEIRSCG
jgi:hypothetical protein